MRSYKKVEAFDLFVSNFNGNVDGVDWEKMTRGAYETHTEKCPYCHYDGCEADWVDVGVVQCGLYHCPFCNSSNIDPEFESIGGKLSEKEYSCGWYDPNRKTVKKA